MDKNYSKFKALKLEKRKRILNKAFKEFADNGYYKPSTNQIVKESNISKGSLFSYFNTKKGPYLFLLHYAADLVNDSYDGIDLNNRDIFDRIRQSGLINFEIMKTFPEVFNFLKSAFNEESNEVNEDIEKIRLNIITNGFEKIYENIDFSLFKEGIDIKKAIDILNWSMLGFATEKVDKINSYDNITDEEIKEWDQYAAILKDCFYKDL